MSNEWLKNLKAGDEVIVSRHGFSPVLKQVAKSPATRINLTDGTTFKRRDGISIGTSIYVYTLKEATPELKKTASDAMAKERLVGRLNANRWEDWNCLTLDQLERIAAVLNES